jgi:hypothetical protein
MFSTVYHLIGYHTVPHCITCSENIAYWCNRQLYCMFCTTVYTDSISGQDTTDHHGRGTHIVGVFIVVGGQLHVPYLEGRTFTFCTDSTVTFPRARWVVFFFIQLIPDSLVIKTFMFFFIELVPDSTCHKNFLITVYSHTYIQTLQKLLTCKQHLFVYSS